MNFKKHRTRWLAALCLLCTTLLPRPQAIGQANYFTIFGNAGCSNNNRMTCAVTPATASFTGLPNQIDYYEGLTPPWPSTHYFKNSVYDKAGRLLFSANANGIYAPTGAQIHTIVGLVSTAITPVDLPQDDAVLHAMSEIVIFPVSCHPNSYYVMFWCDLPLVYHPIPTAWHSGVRALRVIRVDIVPELYGTAAAESDWYHIADQFLNPPTSLELSRYERFVCEAPVEIAADKLNPDGSRDVYVMQDSVFEDIYSTAHYYPLIEKWTFPADGSIPTTYSTVYMIGDPGDPRPMRTYSTKLKIFEVPSGSGGTHKLLAWVGRNPDNHGGALQTYNLTTGDMHRYGTPSWNTNGDQDINGFEYIAGDDRFYFSYEDIANTTGGLAYATRGSGATPTTITTVTSTYDYRASDMELTKNGDLLLVRINPSTSAEELAYLSASSLTSPTTLPAPTPLTVSCSGTEPVSVNNHQLSELALVGVVPTSSYLGTQIRGEDYDRWSEYGDIVISGTETWTPTNNPVKNASGASSVSTVSFRSITILPGGSLTIQGMTVKMAPTVGIIKVLAGSSGAGGRLVLDNTTVTPGTDLCEHPAWAMWRGIRVNGTIPASQLPLSTTKQAMLTMINSSEINYADTAVLLAGGNFFGLPTGGGIIQAKDSRFINNSYGVIFRAFNNTNPSTGATINNMSSFYGCKFDVNDDNVIYAPHPPGSMYHIAGDYVKGIGIYGCDFDVNCHVPLQAVAILARNMGFTVDNAPAFSPPGSYTPSTFKHFSKAIWHMNLGEASYLPIVRNSVFESNTIGIEFDLSDRGIVVNNKFKVPPVWGLLISVFPPIYFSFPVQTIGLYLDRTPNFSVYLNSFEYGTPLATSPWGVGNGTVGILASNTGDNNKFINNNSFKGLGTGNLANYDNRNGNNGLWYKCNAHTNNDFDIAVRGASPGDPQDFNTAHGIRPYQGYPSGSYGAGYADGLPGGNTFSLGSGKYNLYNKMTECYTFDYFYATVANGGLPIHQPGLPGSTGITYDASVDVEDLDYGVNQCAIETRNVYGGGRMNLSGGRFVINIDGQFTEDQKLVAINDNIAYYMTDTGGHRDSVYYWLNEANTPDAAATTAYMLLEDTLVDSAYTVYTSIPGKFQLSDDANNYYDNWGKQLFSLQLIKSLQAGAPSVTFGDIAAEIDTLSDSTINAIIVESILDVFNNATGAAKLQAQNMLLQYSQMLYDSLAQPDTLLYPEPDSMIAPPTPPRGVLTITEFSQGPSGGCQYVELMAAACDKSTAPYVDIRGWHIDDHAGLLTEDCDPLHANPGNFRLADDDIWSHVIPGSILVLYNGDANCYNLPDTFTIDTFNSVYYLPIGSVTGYSHLLQFTAAENTDVCNYCSDTGTTVYDTANNWGHAYLDTVFDAIQVLCPGCTSEHPGTPSRYFVAAYYPLEYEWEPSEIGETNIGKVIIANLDTFRRYKYVFVGANETDLLNPGKWDVSEADTAGPVPPTIGHISPELFDAVTSGALSMPCCYVAPEEEEEGPEGKPGNGKQPTVKLNAGNEQITVYPNPARAELHFRFPADGEVLIKITDITGKTIAEQRVNNRNNATVNIKGITPGMYMYQVVTNKQTHTGKVVITE